MKRHNRDLNKELANQRQRFSIRKLTIGAASVLLGTTLFWTTAGVAQADSENKPPTEQKQEEVQKKNNDQAPEEDTNQAEHAEQQNNDQFNPNNVNATNRQQNNSVTDEKAKAGDAEHQKQIGATTEGKAQTSESADQAAANKKKTNELTENKTGTNKPATGTNKPAKAEESKEPATNNLQVTKQQPVAENAIKESKVATPADQVTATFHIYDAGYNNVDFTNGDMKELPAITITGKKGSTVADLINQRIKEDTEKQLADTTYGYGYVVDSDGQEHLVGISPVVALSDRSGDIVKQQAGYTSIINEKSNFTGGLKDGADQVLGKELANQTILQDMVDKGVIDKPSITEAYNKWLANKKKNYPLAGYKFDPNYNYYGSDYQAGTSGDTKVVNGGDYTITLTHNNTDFKVDKRFYIEVPRTVEFKYYYDKNVPNPDRPEVEGQPPKSTDGYRVDYTNGGEKVDTVGSGNAMVSMKDANTDTSTLIDALPGADGHNRVIYLSVTGRLYDPVLGVVDKTTQENYNNYSGVIQFPGVDAPKVDDWTTYDPAVPASGTDFGKAGTYYYDAFGWLNKGQTHVPNAPTEYLIYYHNQPVDITFEDVTDSAKPVKLSSFDLSKEINVHDNLHYQFDKPHIPVFALKDHYTPYNYKADDNYYTSTNIAIDPNGKLTNAQNLDYNQVLKAYTDNGYVLVGQEVPDLDYDKDKVWVKDSAATANNGHVLQAKHITVKLMRLAKQGDTNKTVTRTIHFVTNTENNPELNPVVEQKVSFHTNDSYWVDTTTGKQIDSTNVKQVTGADGQTYNVVNALMLLKRQLTGQLIMTLLTV